MAARPSTRPEGRTISSQRQLRVGDSLCAAFVPALLVRHGSVHKFLEDSILRKNTTATSTRPVERVHLSISGPLRGVSRDRVRRSAGIVYYAKDGLWIADELLRPFQKFLRLVFDDVTDSAQSRA